MRRSWKMESLKNSNEGEWKIKEGGSQKLVDTKVG